MGVLKIINISLKRGKYKIDIKKSKSHKLQSTIPKLRLHTWNWSSISVGATLSKNDAPWP